MKKANKKKAEKLNEIMAQCAKSLVVVNKSKRNDDKAVEEKYVGDEKATKSGQTVKTLKRSRVIESTVENLSTPE